MWIYLSRCVVLASSSLSFKQVNCPAHIQMLQAAQQHPAVATSRQDLGWGSGERLLGRWIHERSSQKLHSQILRVNSTTVLLRNLKFYGYLP